MDYKQKQCQCQATVSVCVSVIEPSGPDGLNLRPVMCISCFKAGVQHDISLKGRSHKTFVFLSPPFISVQNQKSGYVRICEEFFSHAACKSSSSVNADLTNSCSKKMI